MPAARRVRTLVAVVALACGGLALPAHAAHRSPEPTLGALVSGTSAYVHGTYVWTDYAYDDHGANRSATYPDARDQGNGADLVQLQLGLTHGALTVKAVLETLTRKDVPLLVVGLDTDNDPRTGAATLPGWTAKGPLGLDRLVVVSGAGATLRDWDGTGWRTERRLTATVDPGTNVVATTVPGLRLGHRLSAVAALGVAHDSFLDHGGAIFDLAFVKAEDPTNGSSLASAEEVAATGKGHATGGEWQDLFQGQVLAGTRSARDAVAVLDVEAMRAHADRPADTRTPGYHTWLYRSHVPLPEGIVDGTAAGGLFAGPYQPYVVQLPEHPDGSAVLSLHGGGGNHVENGTFAPQGGLLLKGSIGIFPFGREVTTANDHGYQGVSERDVLDALSDAIAHNPVDPGRVVVTGISTGGAGALRFAQLHPDLFSAAFIASAYDDTHLPENLVDLPVVMHNGGVDPAANQPVLALTTTELDQLGDVDYRSYTVAAHQHADLTPLITQCLLDRLAAKRVLRSPGRVVVALDPRTESPGLDLEHGRAYWVRAARLRPGAPASVWHTAAGDPPGYGQDAAGRVDLTTGGVARRTRTASTVEGHGENVTAGADLCGPNPAVHTDDVWRIHGMAQALGAPLPVTNTLSGSLAAVGDVTVDLARAGLRTTAPLDLTLSGDGPTTLRLVGAWSPRSYQLVRDGTVVATVRPSAGALVLQLAAAGTHVFEVR